METKRPRAPSPSAMAASPAPAPPPSPSGAPLAFAGSSERDVALAKSFWNSVTLQPPLESRLDPRRGSVCSCLRRSSEATATAGTAIPSAASSANDHREEDRPSETEKDGWKGQCLEKAKKREEIIALLKKQREERILKEMLSRPHKPKGKTQQREQESNECSRKEKEESSDLEDEESVKALP